MTPPLSVTTALRRWSLLIVLSMAGAAALPALASASDTPTELGVELIPWSKKLGERRYESPRDWDATIKFFRDKFKGWKTIKWTREVSLPAVKYVHIANTADNGKWEGINIYALPDGRVRFYLLTRESKPAAAGKAAPGGAPADGAPADAEPETKAPTG